MRIGEILEAKEAASAGSPAVVTVAPEAGVRELLAVLAEAGIGAVVVSSDGQHPEGIVSERDVVRHLRQNGTVVDNTVGAIMTALVESCAPGDDLDAVLATMTQRRFRHVPVLDDTGVLLGIVSIGDLVKHKIGELQCERDQLDSYVRQS